MRRTLLLLVSLFKAITLAAQIPVTDVATNASIGFVGNQLANMNVQLTSMNQSLSRIINLLEENNQVTDDSKNILEEELNAKKTSPQFVIQSLDVTMTMELKNKILEAYRTSKQSIQQWEHLQSHEIQEYIGFSSQAILETTNLFKQCSVILNTKAIMASEERLKKVDGINGKLRIILNDLISKNKKLSQTNAFRQARRTLIKMN